MLKAENLHKTFSPGTINEKKALTGVDISLEEGDFVTVIGGNGAGKSTLLNAIAGVWPVDEGSVRIDGVDVTGLPDYRRAALIGRVFQDPMTGTAATMGIEENLALAARRGKRRTLRWGITERDREEYREKLGIEPEPKKEPKKEDKKQEFKNINEVDEIKSDELSDESVDNGMEYSAVEDIFYVDPNPKKMDIPDEPLAKVKPKQYIFQLEDVDKEKPEEKEEEKDVIIEELSGSGADADSKNYTNVIQADNLVDDMADLNTFVDTNTKVLWTATKSDPNMSKADRDWNLSNIIALHVLRNEIIKEVKQPSITNDALEQKAAQIRGDASYSRLFGKDSPDYLRRQTPDKMLTDYDKYAEEGEFVAVGKPLFKIADMSRMYLRAYITSQRLEQVKTGQNII